MGQILCRSAWHVVVVVVVVVRVQDEWKADKRLKRGSCKCATLHFSSRLVLIYHHMSVAPDRT